MPPRTVMVRLVPAVLLPLLACGGRDAGFSARPTSFPLPAGVYEVRVALEFDAGDPDWTLPLPEAVEARLVVSEPNGDHQELNFFGIEEACWGAVTFGVSARDQVWFERDPDDEYPESVTLVAAPSPGRCRRALALRATGPSFVARDRDGDGTPESIEGMLAGTATEEVPEATDQTHEPTRPFRGRLVAVPDRTPPALVPSPDPVSPFGAFPLRFSEPVFFEDQDFALDVDGEPVPLAHPWATLPTGASDEDVVGGDHPLTALLLFQPGPRPVPLAPGAAVRLAHLRVRDLAGNVLDQGPAETGLRVTAPEGRPVESFEDGALAGWVAIGDVRAVRSSPELPALDGDWLVEGSWPGGFSLTARIDVPDSAAPALVFATDLPQGGPVALFVTVGDEVDHVTGSLPTYEGVTEQRVDLSPFRGRTVHLVLELVGNGCGETSSRTVVLDSFRIVP